MSKNMLRRMLYLVLVVAIGFVGYFAGVLTERTGTNAGSYVTEALKLKKLGDVIEHEYYFQEDIDKEEAFERAMASYVNQLGDPFSSYISGADLDSFTEEVEGNYVGIGVEITVDEDNFITVINSFDGSAAQVAGIKTGDRIITVYGETYTGDQLDEVVDKIRGLPGETVDLEILTAEGEIKPITLTRSEVSVETVRVRMLNDSIGYVRISSFDLETDKEFFEKMKFFDFTKVKGLVVDLRSNSGGTLDSTVAIADYLMPEGKIVSVKYRNGEELTETSDAQHAVNVPICVLINEGTASAAELLSGGLRDNNQAVLIGKNSYGKGVVGQTFQIDSQSAVLLTVGEYFLPCGDNIHKIGLKPDIEVDIDNQNTSIFLLPESEDAQLQRAIEELKR
ncbi:MAG: S41 family peptidase [Clostridia bacterium]|nr:S41 family peptidase [Clostridia bacterium]